MRALPVAPPQLAPVVDIIGARPLDVMVVALPLEVAHHIHRRLLVLLQHALDSLGLVVLPVPARPSHTQRR